MTEIIVNSHRFRTADRHFPLFILARRRAKCAVGRNAEKFSIHGHVSHEKWRFRGLNPPQKTLFKKSR